MDCILTFIRTFSFVLSLQKEVSKCRTGVRVLKDGPFIDDALSLVDIAFVSEEAVNTRLHGLLDYKLLDHHVDGAPQLNHIGNQLVFAVVDKSLRVVHMLPHVLEDVLGRNDSLLLVHLAAVVNGTSGWQL